MKPLPQKRRDRRHDSTRIALIESAERMFAEHGVDAVSIRQIGISIGSANPSVVGYYFGNKALLIEAVYRHRLETLDTRRAELLESLNRRTKTPDLAALLDVIWRPVLELVDRDGKHRYAAFLASMSRGEFGHLRLAIRDDYPATKAAIAQTHAMLPHRCLERLPLRWPIVTDMMLNAFVLIDRLPKKGVDDLERSFCDAVAMTAAALMA